MILACSKESGRSDTEDAFLALRVCRFVTLVDSSADFVEGDFGLLLGVWFLGVLFPAWADEPAEFSLGSGME